MNKKLKSPLKIMETEVFRTWLSLRGCRYQSLTLSSENLEIESEACYNKEIK